MVEGGGSVLTQFLTEDLADELQLVVAPVFVGDARARRFVGDGRFPWSEEHRATLVETQQIGGRGPAALRPVPPLPLELVGGEPLRTAFCG